MSTSKKINLEWQPVQITGERTNNRTYTYVPEANRLNSLQYEFLFDGEVYSGAWCADREIKTGEDGRTLPSYRDPETGRWECVYDVFPEEMFHVYRWDKNNPGKCIYTSWMTRGEFLARVQVRPEQAKAKKYNKWVDDIQVGDFVRCTGQRSANVWKKILVINRETFVAMQYTKPIDDVKYVHGYSSETLIANIKEKHV